MRSNQHQIQKISFSRRSLFLAGAALSFHSLQNPNLNARQKSILLGTGLGDGHFQLSPNGTKARLRFTHGAAQVDYVSWQYNELGDLCATVKEPYITQTKKGYYECIGYTSYRTEIQPYHRLFYKDIGDQKPKYRKIIPPDFSTHLKDPEALMVWYLDDGTLRSDGGAVRIATQGFSLPEILILQDCLYKNFNIKAEIEETSKLKPFETGDPFQNESLCRESQYGLTILSRKGEAGNFIRLFRDTVVKEIPSMTYKVQRYL